jgi:hypothetical protein
VFVFFSASKCGVVGRRVVMCGIIGRRHVRRYLISRIVAVFV